MNSYHDPSFSPVNNPRCIHCGKYYCQIDFIFSWLSRYGNSNDQRIQEMISKYDRKTKRSSFFF
jgi:hypothetical protein